MGDLLVFFWDAKVIRTREKELVTLLTALKLLTKQQSLSWAGILQERSARKVEG